MIILVDTNVILDVLLKREPYNNAAQTIVAKCAAREVMADYIVTRNVSDYQVSGVKAIEPDEFVKLL